LKSHIKPVTKYIERQEEHHRKQKFLEEYKVFKKNFEVEHNEEYIMEELNNNNKSL